MTMRAPLTRLCLAGLALLMLCGTAWAGSPLPKIPGSSWLVPLKASFDMGKRIGTYQKYTVWTYDNYFYFGPQPSLGLKSNVFAWYCADLDSTDDIVEPYKVSKDTITLNVTKAQMEAVIRENMRHIADHVEGVTLSNLKESIPKFKPCSCKFGFDRKKKPWLELRYKTEFEYSFNVKGKKYKGKGKMDVYGKGKPE